MQSFTSYLLEEGRPVITTSMLRAARQISVELVSRWNNFFKGNHPSDAAASFNNRFARDGYYLTCKNIFPQAPWKGMPTKDGKFGPGYLIEGIMDGVHTQRILYIVPMDTGKDTAKVISPPGEDYSIMLTDKHSQERMEEVLLHEMVHMFDKGTRDVHRTTEEDEKFYAMVQSLPPELRGDERTIRRIYRKKPLETTAYIGEMVLLFLRDCRKKHLTASQAREKIMKMMPSEEEVEFFGPKWFQDFQRSTLKTIADSYDDFVKMG